MRDFSVLAVRTGDALELKVVSTPAGFANTETDSDCFCKVNWTSTRFGDSLLRVIRAVALSNPASVTVNSYSPGRTAANEYTPSSSETVVTSLPDVRLFSVTRALGHTVCTGFVSVKMVPDRRAVSAGHSGTKPNAERRQTSARRQIHKTRNDRGSHTARTKAMVPQWDGFTARFVRPARNETCSDTDTIQATLARDEQDESHRNGDSRCAAAGTTSLFGRAGLFPGDLQPTGLCEPRTPRS